MIVPVNTPLLEGNEKKYVNEVLILDGFHLEGPFVRKFEENFSKTVNRNLSGSF